MCSKIVNLILSVIDQLRWRQGPRKSVGNSIRFPVFVVVKVCGDKFFLLGGGSFSRDVLYEQQIYPLGLLLENSSGTV